MGLSFGSRWGGYDSVVSQSIGSFSPLTDRGALAIQPQRIALEVDQFGIEGGAQSLHVHGELAEQNLLQGLKRCFDLAARIDPRQEFIEDLLELGILPLPKRCLPHPLEGHC